MSLHGNWAGNKLVCEPLDGAGKCGEHKSARASGIRPPSIQAVDARIDADDKVSRVLTRIPENVRRVFALVPAVLGG